MTYVMHRTGIFTKDYVMFTTMGCMVRIRPKRGEVRTLPIKEARAIYRDLRDRGWARGPSR